MKKNLRIVSAAAAALLAVAPVAATAVSTVSADAVTTATNLNKVPGIANGSTVSLVPNVHLNTSAPGDVAANLSVSFNVNFNGTNAVSNFTPNVSNISLFKPNGEQVSKLEEVENGFAGSTFRVVMTHVGLNFGSQNANKKFTLTLPKGDTFSVKDKNNDITDKNSAEITLDENGAITLDGVSLHVQAKDFANPAVVNWRSAQTGANVNSGNITLYAGSDAGKMNVAAVVAEAKRNYYAENSVRPQASHITYTDNLKDSLKAMGVDVDANGWFTAPKSFNFNLTAKADNNDASSTLAVTVNVPNGKETTPATEASKSVTVMHNAFFYGKDGKRVGSDKAATYSSLDLATDTATKSGFKEVTISGKTYYKVANKDEYVNASNITGTSKTLKHNAYVYKTAKKRANKKVLKKGSSQTVYGAAVRLSNGKLYYRIGRTQYVKAANF